MEVMSTHSAGSLCTFGDAEPSFLSDILGDGWAETLGSKLGAEAAEESKDLLAGDTKNSVSFQGTLEGRPVKQTKGAGAGGEAGGASAAKWKIAVRIESVTSLSAGVYEETQVMPGGLDIQARETANGHPDALAVQRALHFASGKVDEYLTELHARTPTLASKHKGVPRVAIEELRDVPLPTQFMELIPLERRGDFEKFRLCQVPFFKIPDAEARKKFQEKHRKPMSGVPPYLGEAALLETTRETLATSPTAVEMLWRVLALVSCELKTFAPGQTVSFNTSDNISRDRLKVMANGVISVVVLQLRPGTKELVVPLRYYQCKKGVKSIGPRLDDGSRFLYHIESGNYTDLHPRGSFMQKHYIAVGAAPKVVDVDDPERHLRGPEEKQVGGRANEKLMLPICSVAELTAWMTRPRGTAALLVVDRPELPEGGGGAAESEKEADGKYNSMLMFWKKDLNRESNRLTLAAPAYAWSSPVLADYMDAATGNRYLDVDLTNLTMYKVKVALYGEEIAKLGIPENACTAWVTVAPRIVPSITGIYEAQVDVRGSNAISEATLKRATNSEDEGGIRKEFDDAYSAFRVSPATVGKYRFWNPDSTDRSPEANEARELLRQVMTRLFKLKPSCGIATFSGTMLWEPKEIIASSGIEIPRASALYILEKQRMTAKLSQGVAANGVSDVRNLSVVLADGETMASRVAAIPDTKDWIFYYVGPLTTQFSNSVLAEERQCQARIEAGKAGTLAQYGAIFHADYDKAKRAEYDTYMQAHGMRAGHVLHDARIQTGDLRGIVYAVTRPLDKATKMQRVREILSDMQRPVPALPAATTASSGSPLRIENGQKEEGEAEAEEDVLHLADETPRPKRKFDDTTAKPASGSNKVPKLEDLDDLIDF